MRKVINGLKFVVKFGGIIFAVVEIINFAIEKLTPFADKTEKKQQPQKQ